MTARIDREQPLRTAYSVLQALIHELGRSWPRRDAAEHLVTCFGAIEVAMQAEPLDHAFLLANAYVVVEFFEIVEAPEVAAALEAARDFLLCCGRAYGLRPSEIPGYPAVAARRAGGAAAPRPQRARSGRVQRARG